MASAATVCQRCSQGPIHSPWATQTELTSDPMDSEESKARDGVIAIFGCQLNYLK